MEKQRTYSRAIDSYLKITQAQTNDMDALEGIWIKAARLAEDYEPSRLQEVVTIVASRLAAVNRNAAATALLVRHNLVKEAIDICVKALDFERAKDIANQRAPQFLPMLEQAQHAHLIAANQLDSLGQINAGAALEVLVAQGNWDKVFEQAAKEGTGVVQRYAVHYASILIKDRKFVNALEVFVKYGAPCVPAHYNLYRRLAHDVLAQPRQNLARERSMAQVIFFVPLSFCLFLVVVIVVVFLSLVCSSLVTLVHFFSSSVFTRPLPCSFTHEMTEGYL